MFEGTHCFKHFVAINLKEPDKLGYWRKIDQISYRVVESEFEFNKGSRNMLILTEIKAKSYMWH